MSNWFRILGLFVLFFVHESTVSLEFDELLELYLYAQPGTAMPFSAGCEKGMKDETN